MRSPTYCGAKVLRMPQKNARSHLAWLLIQLSGMCRLNWSMPTTCGQILDTPNSLYILISQIIPDSYHLRPERNLKLADVSLSHAQLLVTQYLLHEVQSTCLLSWKKNLLMIIQKSINGNLKCWNLPQYPWGKHIDHPLNGISSKVGRVVPSTTDQSRGHCCFGSWCLNSLLLRSISLNTYKKFLY